MGTVISGMEMFHFNENVETIDTYVQRIRQMVAMLNYGGPFCLQVYMGYFSQLRT